MKKNPKAPVQLAAIIGVLVSILAGALLFPHVRALFTGSGRTYRLGTAPVLGYTLVLALLVFLVKTLLDRIRPGWMSRSLGLDNSFDGLSWQMKPGLSPLQFTILGLVLLLLFFSPYFFLGQGVHVKIFDNLDSYVAKVKVLAESGYAFSLDPSVKIPNIINGLNLSGFPPGYNIGTLLFVLFPPFVAYMLNVLIMALLAFFGMRLLLRHFVLKDTPDPWIITGTAICFAVIPFYPPGGISIAGLPLLLFAFLKLRNREIKPRYFVIILLYPFYSLLQHAGVFVIICLGVLFLVDSIKKKTINWWFFFALFFLGAGYLLSYFHLIYSFLSPQFVSFREEIAPGTMGVKACLAESMDNFMLDRTNVISGHQLYILLAAITALVWGMLRGIKKTRLLAAMVGLTLLTSLLWGFKYWSATAGAREKLQILNAFNFARFYWLNPFLWYIVFALALVILLRMKAGRVVVSLLLILQLAFLFTFYNPDFRRTLGGENLVRNSLSFSEFYSQELFEDIAGYINKPKHQYRVVNLGFHPAVTQYNGFYTLDLYTPIYPLEYKHRFRRIIEPELRGNKGLAKGFENNAKRCYLMAAELHGIKKHRGRAFTRGITKQDARNIKIKNLSINPEALKDMGGQYIFSAVRITNHAQNGLLFEKAFSRKGSPWKIYLYKVKP